MNENHAVHADYPGVYAFRLVRRCHALHRIAKTHPKNITSCETSHTDTPYILNEVSRSNFEKPALVFLDVFIVVRKTTMKLAVTTRIAWSITIVFLKYFELKQVDRLV